MCNRGEHTLHVKASFLLFLSSCVAQFHNATKPVNVQRLKIKGDVVPHTPRWTFWCMIEAHRKRDGCRFQSHVLLLAPKLISNKGTSKTLLLAPRPQGPKAKIVQFGFALACVRLTLRLTHMSFLHSLRHKSISHEKNCW